MRRRQAFQQQVEVGKNPVELTKTPVRLTTEPVKLTTETTSPVELTTGNTAPPKTLGRGYCKHCSKYIGKGIYFHEKYCNVRNI